MLVEVDMKRIMEEKQRLLESVAEQVDYDLLDDSYLPESFVVNSSATEIN